MPSDVVCRANKTRLYPAKKIETEKVSKASEYSVIHSSVAVRLLLRSPWYFRVNRGGRAYMPTPAWWGLKTPWFLWTFRALNANTTCVFLSLDFAYTLCVLWPSILRNISVGCFSVQSTFRILHTSLHPLSTALREGFDLAVTQHVENNCSRYTADL